MKKINIQAIATFSFYIIGSIWLLLHLIPKTAILQSFWPFTLSGFSHTAFILPGLILSAISIFLPSKYFTKYDTITLNNSTYCWILRGTSFFILLLLFIYSIKHNFFGDGNLIKALTGASLDTPFKIGQQNIKPLISLLSSRTDWSTEITFRILSIAGGILYFTGLYILLKDVKYHLFGIITLLIFSSQPFIIFFSNYIETYPLLAGIFFLYLSLSIKLGSNYKNNIILSIILLILFFLHPLFAILLLGHIARLLLFYSKKRSVIPSTLILSIAGGFIYFFYSTSANGPVFGGAFLPVFPNSNQIYTLLSNKHYSDLCKYFLFLFFPISLTLLISTKVNFSFSSRYSILLPFIFPILVFLFLADFKLGAFDWDVFITFSLPVLLYPLFIYMDSEGNSPRLQFSIFILGLSIAQLVPWLAINSTPEKAADFAIHTSKFDPHQQIGTRKYSLSTRLRDAGLKERALSLSKNLNKQDGETNVVAKNNYARSLIENGKYQKALTILQEITRKYPGYFHGNANLGELYIEHFNKPDSAYKYLSVALSQRPDASHVLYALAFIDMRSGRISQAKETFEKVISIDPLHADAHAKLGMICLQVGERDRGIQLFERAIKLGGIPEPTKKMICSTFAQLGLTDKAKECFEKIQK